MVKYFVEVDGVMMTLAGEQLGKLNEPVSQEAEERGKEAMKLSLQTFPSHQNKK